jgi:hypothetical protein
MSNVHRKATAIYIPHSKPNSNIQSNIRLKKFPYESTVGVLLGSPSDWRRDRTRDI